MDLNIEYVVIMVEEDGYEVYEYFEDWDKCIKYAESIACDYVAVAIKKVDYIENIEEIVWESEDC